MKVKVQYAEVTGGKRRFGVDTDASLKTILKLDSNLDANQALLPASKAKSRDINQGAAIYGKDASGKPVLVGWATPDTLNMVINADAAKTDHGTLTPSQSFTVGGVAVSTAKGSEVKQVNEVAVDTFTDSDVRGWVAEGSAHGEDVHALDAK